MSALPLFEDPFLRAQWSAEFDAFESSPESAALLTRLRAWASRDVLKETSSEAAFIQRFFVETWGYHLQGHVSAYTCRPQYEVSGAGQTGGRGSADLALGHFTADAVPQVLCEFKDIRSGLDAKQARKGNTRSPVEQCFDYLHSAATPSPSSVNACTVPKQPLSPPHPKKTGYGPPSAPPPRGNNRPKPPAGLSASDLTAWAKQQHATALQNHYDTLDTLL